jgi:ribose transport system substrate-binding protein
VLADKIDAAGIPLIAVDIPHPHATFFGVNNYRVVSRQGNAWPSMRRNFGTAKCAGPWDWTSTRRARWCRAA